jgi:hypothetical protein
MVRRKTPTETTRARPPTQGRLHRPTDRLRGQVEAFVVAGIAQEHIATLTGVSVDLLAKHYAPELASASHKANAIVAQQLYRQAANLDVKGRPGKGETPANVQMQASIAWLKMRAGWRDKGDEAPRVSVTVSGSGPTQVNVQALSDDELGQLARLLERAAPPPALPEPS